MQSNWKTQCSIQTLKQRALLLVKIREYFAQENVLEVETPLLSSSGNTDINIESFTAQKINHDFDCSYLRTSPEFPLKRLLCSGVGDVFEIGKVFRKGEISKSHNCEFTMLEWYRIGFKYSGLIQDVTSLFNSVFLLFNIALKKEQVLSFTDCFKTYLAIDISISTVEQLNDYCQENGYSGSQLTKDEAMDYMFATQIQPRFGKNKLTFVTLYPASQAALAQINPDDENTSLRFEVFYQGHELGNGYQELTNGKELLQRFKDDNSKRAKHVTIDNNLINAMNQGLPNCSGIAVGIDRLLMVLLNKQTINEVMTFNAENS